jgi:hypothetical protein
LIVRRGRLAAGVAVAAVAAAAVVAVASDGSGDGSRHTAAGAPCASADAGLPGGYERSSVVVGPVALYPARDYAHLPADAFRARVRGRERRYTPIEATVRVAGPQSAMLRIPSSERRHLRLMFDRSRFRDDGLYLLSAGADRATFGGCKGSARVFHGGFLATRRGCFAVDVDLDGNGAGPSKRVTVPFGAPCKH